MSPSTSFAMTVFWIGLMLLIIFAVALRWLPVGGRIDPVMGAFFEPVTRLYLVEPAGETRRSADLDDTLPLASARARKAESLLDATWLSGSCSARTPAG